MIDCNFNFDYEENKLHINPISTSDMTISYKIHDIDTNIIIGKFDNIKTNSSYWTSFSVSYKEFKFLNGWVIRFYEDDNLILEKEYKIRNNKPFCTTKFKTIEDNISLLMSGRLFANLTNTTHDDQYNTFELDKCETVIDLGSSIGIFSAHALTKNPDLKIVTVEMAESFYNVCHNTFKDNPNVVTLNNAIHIKSDEDIIYYTDNENGENLGNSIIENQYNYINAIIEKSVKTISIKDIIKRYNFDTVSLLKMDIEGYEYDIIENLTDETLSKIERIHLEFHNCDHIFRRYNIIDKLCRNGFSFETSYDNVNIYDSLFTLYFTKIKKTS